MFGALSRIELNVIEQVERLAVSRRDNDYTNHN